MKRPNGSGTAYKLSGKRRNPWIACFTEWTADGKRKRNIIGYYSTRKDALTALAAYEQQPWATSRATVAEIYEQWSRQKFPTLSQNSINVYRTSYKHLQSVADRQIASLKHAELQKLIDVCQGSRELKQKIKVLLNQLYNFAVVNEIIEREKHTVEFLNVGKIEKSTMHFRFTDAEVEKIFAFAENDMHCALIAMLIYSGCRPGELLNLMKSDVDIEERWFFIRQGKTKNAVRKVPIALKTLDFWRRWMDTEGEYLIDNGGKPYEVRGQQMPFWIKVWKPALISAGCFNYTAEDGTEREHLPHDCRHTFASMWAEKGLNEMYRRRIQGHAGAGIGEQVYTHLEMKKLTAEIDKL